jgi:hypothetical protein
MDYVAEYLRDYAKSLEKNQRFVTGRDVEETLAEYMAS